MSPAKTEAGGGPAKRKLKILMLHVSPAVIVNSASTRLPFLEVWTPASVVRLVQHFCSIDPHLSADQLTCGVPTGYTQSGELFHAKTRAHEKLLAKAFPSTPASPIAATYPGGVQLFYPTAPLRLMPADIPGYSPAGEDGGDAAITEAWGWWQSSTWKDKYNGIEDGLKTVANAIREAGGVDGIIGFSQGGAMASFVASLLEDGREEAFAEHKCRHASALEYPASFASLKNDIGQQQLKFAVSYSGFYANIELYRAFYEPKIKTKMLHVIGSLDSVVDEGRSRALIEACEDQRAVFYHPGGHFVPSGKEASGVLTGFIKECCTVRKEEDSEEDLDVPF